MIYTSERPWSPIASPAMIVIPAHSATRDGKLMMNWRLLEQVQSFIPGIDAVIGELISNVYGFMPVHISKTGKASLGLFQIKARGDVDKDIIRKAVKSFGEYVRGLPGWNFRLVYPGELDDTLLEGLPNNVSVTLVHLQTDTAPHVSLKDYYMRVCDDIMSGNLASARSTITFLGGEDPESTVKTIQKGLIKQRKQAKEHVKAHRAKKGIKVPIYDYGDLDL